MALVRLARYPREGQKSDTDFNLVSFFLKDFCDF